MPISISEVTAELKARAQAENISVLKITSASLPLDVGERLHQFVALDRHGDMEWMDETRSCRVTPQAMWPGARSAIMLALPYSPDFDPMARLLEKSTGTISVYALNRDYHDLFKGKLKRLAQWFAKTSKAQVKVFVDTAPLMEKPLAAQAGLGWQGKHTNLVSRDLGSWFFIGSILTTADLPLDASEQDHCGSCRNCLDVCPTKAFPAPYQLDARRCISYLTIEHKGHIAEAFRKPMGNRIYGCDDCLAVCPWNKFAVEAKELKLKARADLISPKLSVLLALDDAAFRSLFSGSPVKRIGRDRFVRNCLIAAGNSGDKSLIPEVEKRLRDASPVVRAMAVWALKQLAQESYWQGLRGKHLVLETDPDVRQEWR